MFLRPTDGAGPSPWPGGIEGEGGRASVHFHGDVPILAAEGDAVLVVEPRRRLGRRATPIVVEDRAGVPAPMRAGDALALEMDGDVRRWRYDPDGNLNAVGLWFLRVATAGTAVAMLAIGGILGMEAGLLSDAYRIAGDPPRFEGPDLVRRNAPRVYPAKPREASPYLRALIDARTAREDVPTASEAWIEANPLPGASKDDRR